MKTGFSRRFNSGFLAYFLMVSVLTFSLFSSAASAETGAVLFDNSHLESIGNANWTITGGFSDFADTIKGMGYKVDEFKTGVITSELLKKYDVFIIPEPNIKFTDLEEAAIIDYVKNGGSLYLVADHMGADRNNDGWDAVKIFNNFSQPFGLKFAEKWIKKEMPIRGKFEQTDITKNVKFCGTWGGTTVDILDPAIARGHIFVSEANGSGAYIATSEYQKGRVVAYGDSSPFDDGSGDKGAVDLTDGYNLLDADHRQLAVNTMCYLLRKDPKDYPVKIKFYFEGGKLNCKENEAKEFPIVMMNQSSKELSGITLDFYRNRPFDEKMKFHTTTVEKIAAGEKVKIMLPFKQENRMMFTLYTTVKCDSDRTADIQGFNSIMVGVPMMVLIDSFHENDYVNRIKMLKNAFEEEGIFYTRSKVGFSDQALLKTDIIVMTAPKKGFLPPAEEITALMSHLKKGRSLVICGTGPDSNWGDNANLNELLKSLSIPATLGVHSAAASNGGKAVEFKLKENGFVKSDDIDKIYGEAPSAVTVDMEAAKKLGLRVETITTLPGNEVPTGVIIDGSKSSLGFDKIAVLGSFHMTDQSYSQDLSSPTHIFNMRLLRALSPKQPAFNSQAPAPAPGSETKGARQNMFVRGIAKAYLNGILYITDFGVTREIRVNHKLSEKDALSEFAKFKGKLVRVNLGLNPTDPAAEGFESVEYKK